MAEVVVLISYLIFADLQSGTSDNATTEIVLREMGNFDAVANYASASPDPERQEAVYLTFFVDGQAVQFAEAIRNLDGVHSVYVKPAAEPPK